MHTEALNKHIETLSKLHIGGYFTWEDQQYIHMNR